MTIIDTTPAPRRKFGPITTANQPDMAMRDTFQGYPLNDPGPPALKAWYCRNPKCGALVPSDRATCLKCKEVQSERA